MRPIQRTGLVDQVITALRRQIADGHWPLGAQIPTEPELAQMTGTGRNTVREAVQALVHDGMLERRQGSGTFVTATTPAGGSLESRFDSASDRDLLELRRALEVTAAELAAARRTEEDVRRLAGLLDRIEKHHGAGETTAAAEADTALHEAIVAATGNALFTEMYRTLLPRLLADIDRQARHTGSMYSDEHRALVAAIAAADPAAAGDLARSLVDLRLDLLP